jgi:hypothetical protein
MVASIEALVKNRHRDWKRLRVQFQCELVHVRLQLGAQVQCERSLSSVERTQPANASTVC